MTTMLQPIGFTAPSGRSFVYLSRLVRSGELMFSPDGTSFYELVPLGYSGYMERHQLSFENPHDDTRGQLVRDGDTLMFEGERYVRQDIVFDAKDVVKLPVVRKVEYLFRSKRGTFYYVSSDKYYNSYETFKLYVGRPSSMSEITIQDVLRPRGFGATHIETAQKTLLCPSGMQRDVPPRWGTQQLVKLNHEEFDIVETLDGKATITRR